MSFDLKGDNGEVGFSLTVDYGRRSGVDCRKLFFAVLTADRRSTKDRRNPIYQRIKRIGYSKYRHARK